MRSLNRQIVATWLVVAFLILVLLVVAIFDQLSLGEALALALAGLALEVMGVMLARLLSSADDLVDEPAPKEQVERLSQRVSELDETCRRIEQKLESQLKLD